MPTRMSPGIRYSIAFVILIGAFVTVRLLMPPPAPPVPPPATQIAATLPATEPTPTPTPATVPVQPPQKLLDVIRDEQPDYPTKEELDLPADLPDAARVELSSPVYLDGVGNLWITDPRGPSVADVLKKPLTGHTIIIRETVRCVLWDPNNDRPDVFVDDIPAQTGTKQILAYTFSGDHPDAPTVQSHPHDGADWSRAIRFKSLTVVPAEHFVLIIKPLKIRRRVPVEGDGKAVVLASSADELFAWQPWDNAGHGGQAIRLNDDGQPTTLTADNGFADKIIQLVPLADGGVMIVSRGDDGNLQLKLKGAPNPQPFTPEQKRSIDTLARQMANRDPTVREKATNALEALGPTVFPELEAIRDRMPPESQVRIEALLGERFAPTLAGLKPLEGETRTIARFPDGGCILQLLGGGSVNDGGREQTVIPAYIAIRPGRYIQRLDLSAAANFEPAHYKLGYAGDEWVIVDPTDGPKRWIGIKTFPLVDPPLKDYDTFVGLDASHRWIFKSTKRPGKTLIIDPALPDTTPRLPTWTIDAPDGCGWTNTNWPAVKRDQRIFVLGEGGWRLIEKDETYLTKAPTVILPTTNAAVPLSPGDQPFAVGDLVLVVDPSNTVTRYRRNAAGEIPEKAESVFNQGVPTDLSRRVWLDPANRLVFAGDQLTVTFPLGRVPKGIGDMMLRSSR